MRRSDTNNFIQEKMEKSFKLDENVSYIKKIGRLVKKLVILGAVGLLVGPSIYQAVAPSLGWVD